MSRSISPSCVWCCGCLCIFITFHNNEVIMSVMASQITSLTIVCLLNRLLRRRSKKASKLRVAGLCEGNSPVTGEFPAQGPVTQKMLPFDDVIVDSALPVNLGGVSLHFSSSPDVFMATYFRGWYQHLDFMVHFVLEIRWRLRIGDAKPSCYF